MLFYWSYIKEYFSTLQISWQFIGIAPLAGLCALRVAKGDKLFMSVAVIEDNGAFDGVMTAVHEMSHLYVYKDGVTYFFF